MAKIDFDNIFNTMLEAGKTELGKNWKKAADLATSSIRTLAQNTVDIQAMRIKGTITQEQAILKMNLQKDSFKILMLSEKAFGLLMVEAALNAIIDSVKAPINAALKFELL